MRIAGPGPFHRAVLLTAFCCSVLIACGSESESRNLFDESSAPVLIPEDPRFSEGWTFFLEDTPNNYIFTNDSVDFREGADASVSVFGYQVNDIEAFEGGLVFGEETKPLIKSLARSEAGLEQFPGWCDPVVSFPEISACELPVNDTGAIYTMTAPNGSVLLVNSFTVEAALGYLSGEFREATVSEADRYLVDGPFGDPA